MTYTKKELITLAKELQEGLNTIDKNPEKILEYVINQYPSLKIYKNDGWLVTIRGDVYESAN